MSVSHWWISLLIDEAEHARLLPSFRSAVEVSVPDEGQRAIELWRSDPESFESLGDNDHVNEFLWAFNLPGIDDFSKGLFFSGGEFSSYLGGDRMFRFVTIARHPPVAVLWHALGYDRARMLPGVMGNLLAAPNEVPTTLEAVTRAYKGTAAKRLLATGRRLCESSIYSSEPVKQTISHLPDLLTRARDEGRGVIAFARCEL